MLAVRPVATIGDIARIEVERREPAVDESAVDEQVEQLRERSARLETAEKDSENGDFVVHPFQMPTNQFVITSLTYLAGNIICTNPQVQGKFTALTG